MRIVSWNLGYAFSFRVRHDQAWHYLAALDPDIALLQEVLPPAWARERWDIDFRPIRQWGTAIVAKPALKLRSDPEPVAYSATGTVSILDGLDLLVASVHTQVGVPSPEDYAGLDREAIRRPRRASLSHADVGYAIQRARVEGGRFLVGGDWNTARLWDRTHPGAFEADFFARAEADGWVDCYRRFHPEGEGRTWFRGSDAPYQLDHVFCDSTTAAQLTGCEIYAHAAETLQLSDHAPLVVEL
jgi:exonuclease III